MGKTFWPKTAKTMKEKLAKLNGNIFLLALSTGISI